MSDDLVKQARDHAAGLERVAQFRGDHTVALLTRLADEVVRLESQVAALSAEPTDKEADDLWYGISTADVRSFRAGIKAALTAFLRRRSQL